MSTCARNWRKSARTGCSATAKAMPGYTSWPTEVGSTSPGRGKDALRIHRDVTRELGIPLVMHYSGVWDTRAIELHPEWACIGAGRRSRQRGIRHRRHLQPEPIHRRADDPAAAGAHRQVRCGRLLGRWRELGDARLLLRPLHGGLHRGDGHHRHPDSTRTSRTGRRGRPSTGELSRRMCGNYADAVHARKPVLPGLQQLDVYRRPAGRDRRAGGLPERRLRLGLGRRTAPCWKAASWTAAG